MKTYRMRDLLLSPEPSAVETRPRAPRFGSAATSPRLPGSSGRATPGPDAELQAASDLGLVPAGLRSRHAMEAHLPAPEPEPEDDDDDDNERSPGSGEGNIDPDDDEGYGDDDDDDEEDDTLWTLRLHQRASGHATRRDGEAAGGGPTGAGPLERARASNGTAGSA